ncbi:MAG: PAS domain S-box protein, partial [Planctomycetota bacterium]
MKKDPPTRTPLPEEIEALRARVRELEEIVSSHQQREDAHRRNEERFDHVTANALEWFWEVDTEGRYTYSNPVVERIYGYSTEEILGMHFFDLAFPEDRAEVRAAGLGRIQLATPFRETKSRCRRKDGKEIWVISSGVPVFDDSDRLAGYRGSDIDVTELVLSERRNKALLEKLYEARKMDAIGKLAGGVAHYLNNLMTTVIGFSQLLLRRTAEDDENWTALR